MICAEGYHFSSFEENNLLVQMTAIVSFLLAFAIAALLIWWLNDHNFHITVTSKPSEPVAPAPAPAPVIVHVTPAAKPAKKDLSATGTLRKRAAQRQHY